MLGKSFGSTIRVPKGLDPDKDEHSVGPDQQMTKVTAGKERVNTVIY